MDHDFRTTRSKSGKVQAEVIVLPDVDISDPDVYYDDEFDPIKTENFEESSTSSLNESVDLEEETDVKWTKEGPWIKLPQSVNTDENFEELDGFHEPIDYFNFFFGDELMELIVSQSNIYATQFGSTFRTHLEEIQKFVGILLLMGIVRMPRYRCYWNKTLNYPTVSNTFSRDRFQQILKFIHFTNNDNLITDPNSPIFDRFAKIRPFLDHLRTACLKIIPEVRHSIDEQIIPFKGKCKAKQYLPKKPSKWGFKVFARCGISGIVYDFHIYAGKGPTVSQSCGLVSGDYVVKLAETLPTSKTYFLYFDNYFTSIPLQIFLKDRNIYSVGTIRRNRIKNCPLTPAKIFEKSGRGAYERAQSLRQGIVLSQWCDGSIVTLSSTHSSLEPSLNVRRFNKRLQRMVNVECPNVVSEYNKNMGGVDLSDMLMALYRLEHKSSKFYMKIFMWGLNTAITNAWLLYRRNSSVRKTPSKEVKDLLTFTVSISESLIYYKKRVVIPKRGRPSLDVCEDYDVINCRKRQKNNFLSDSIRFDNVGHYPNMNESKSRCRVCKRNTQFACVKCLATCCIVKGRNCFYDFHEKNN